ncbi:MAG: hypothetical protein J5527_14740 [Treponema sp.]|nr:hypothetical protein [Treponema sp.]
MVSSTQKTKNTSQINNDLLLSRTDLATLFHCGLSSIDALDTYASIPRIKIGRHTFFLKSDVMDFILSHRIEAQNE